MSQVLSYEVCIVLFALVVAFSVAGYDLYAYGEMWWGVWFGLMFPSLFVLWLWRCLAEANRSPFDFSEGESELVSGFNVEYMGGLFSIIFICEYGMVLFFCGLTVYLFLSPQLLVVKVIFLGFFFVWVRSSLPRYRYDSLMAVS